MLSPGAGSLHRIISKQDPGWQDQTKWFPDMGDFPKQKWRLFCGFSLKHNPRGCRTLPKYFGMHLAMRQKPMGSHFGVGEFTTHARTYLSGDWDVLQGYDLGFDPQPLLTMPMPGPEQPAPLLGVPPQAKRGDSSSPKNDQGRPHKEAAATTSLLHFAWMLGL